MASQYEVVECAEGSVLYDAARAEFQVCLENNHVVSATIVGIDADDAAEALAIARGDWWNGAEAALVWLAETLVA